MELLLGLDLFVSDETAILDVQSQLWKKGKWLTNRWALRFSKRKWLENTFFRTRVIVYIIEHEGGRRQIVYIYVIEF